MPVKTIDISEADRPLAEYARSIEDETLVITIGGEAVAAVVPFDDFDLENRRVAESRKFQEIVARSKASLDRGEGLTMEEARERLGI